MWFLLALVSALFAAVRRDSEKQLLKEFNHFSIGWTVQLVSLPFILLALIFAGEFFNPLTLGKHFWLPIIVICFGFYPVSTFLYLKSIKHGELSKVIPIQSLGPVIALALAWLLLDQRPSLISCIGISVIITGVYVLSLKGRSLHDPLRPFREDRASRYMLINVILVSLVAVLDKIAIDASEAIYFSFVSTTGAVFAIYVTARMLGVKETLFKRNKLKEISLLGLLMGVAYTAYVGALGSGPVAYVSAVRSSNILFSSLLGIFRYKEPFTLAKLCSLVLIAAGLGILAFG